MNKIILSVLMLIPLVGYGQIWQEGSEGIYYNSGNVGIGISIPSKKLHVNEGDLYISDANLYIQSDLSVGSGYSRFMFNSTDNYIISYTSTHSEAYKLALKANNALGKVAFWTNSLERFIIDQEGKVGIGTKTPQSVLEINTGEEGDAILIIEADTDNAGSETDNARIEMYQDARLIGAKIGFNEDSATPSNHFQMDFAHPSGITENAITVNPYNGKVGFGILATNEDARIVVDGKILAEEIKVQNVPNSDYVFEPDYDLRPLEEVDQFIKENQHLPNIPSAEEFKENGVGLGEMDDILLRKVEELTLYVIEQNENNEQLKKAFLELNEKLEVRSSKLEALEKENEVLKTRLGKLEAEK